MLTEYGSLPQKYLCHAAIIAVATGSEHDSDVRAQYSNNLSNNIHRDRQEK